MINTQTAIQVILISVPACAALICALLMLKLSWSKRSLLEQKTLYLVALYYSVSVILWISMIFFQQLPKGFITVNLLGILVTMIIYVTYYHFIFAVTKVSENEKFHAELYFLPVITFCVVLVWLLTILFEKQQHIAETWGEWIKERNLYHMDYIPELCLLFVSNLACAIMSLFRAIRYRRVVVDYSADKQRGEIGWVYQLIITMFLKLPLLACILLLPGIARPVAMVLLVLLSVFKYTILAHNVLFGNFVLIRHSSDGMKSVPDEQPTTIKQLETYMIHNKPYLKPKLKITDIVGDLGTNRTSLSAMINRYYGMNFCRYVNRFRLEELERLRADPANVHLSDIDLVLMAGFSDWRGYRREIVQRNKSVKDKVIGIKDLKRGDILLYPPNDFIGRAILAITKGTVSYSGIYYGDKNGKQYIAHVYKHAMMLTPFDEFMNVVKICYVRRLNIQSDLDPVLRSANIYLQGNNGYPYTNLVLLGILMVIKKFSKNILHSKKFYDFSLYVSLKIMKVLSKIRAMLGKGENAMICSHYVAKCFSDAGKKYTIKFKPILYDYDDLHKSLKSSDSIADMNSNMNYFVTPYDLFSNAENLIDMGIIIKK